MNEEQKSTDQPQEPAEVLPKPAARQEEPVVAPTSPASHNSGTADTQPPIDGQTSEPALPAATDAAMSNGGPAVAEESDKHETQATLQLHPSRPAVTRLKPKAVGLILVAAAGAVGMALVIGLGGSPSEQIKHPSQNNDASPVPAAETANDNPLLSTLPPTYTWPQSDNRTPSRSTLPPGRPVPGISKDGNSTTRTATAQQLLAAAQARQRLVDLKTLQRQWRQAMNSPEVFPGLDYAAGDHQTTASPAHSGAAGDIATTGDNATNGLIGSSGMFPFGPQGAVGMNSPADATGQSGSIQQEHRDFLNRASAVDTYLAQPLIKPASPYEIQAGTVIPGALVTGINSDLPGQIIGVVTQNVFDSVTGRYLLIPQGSRLLGRYSSVVGNGENRVLIAWQRLILPNGDSIVLDAMPGTDQEGQSGLHDKVDYHFRKLAEAAALSTAIAYGGNLAINPNSTSTNQDVVGNTIAQEASQIGQRIINRQLDVQPTITIRPGWPFRILVNKDIILKPYQP